MFLVVGQIFWGKVYLQIEGSLLLWWCSTLKEPPTGMNIKKETLFSLIFGQTNSNETYMARYNSIHSNITLSRLCIWHTKWTPKHLMSRKT